MRTVRRAIVATVTLVASGVLFAAPALACGPPLEKPTIAALGPNQMVMVGITGERVEGGRLFHVERAFNVDSNITPIVIAFKEGEPIGDCSYPVSAGTHLIIAPYRDPGGRLAADLSTLQADPASPDGKRYLAEAESLFGPGIVPVETTTATVDLSAYPLPPIGLIVVVGLIAAVGIVLLGAWRRRSSSRSA